MTSADIEKLAHLARIHVSDEESEHMRTDLEKILAYVERLSNIDTLGIPETERSGAAHALRLDEAHSVTAETRQLILENFPDRVGDALKVPAVFEKPKG